MATAPVTGSVLDFSRSTLTSPRMWVHPENGPGRASPSLLLSGGPIAVSIGSNGTFSVSLEEHHLYRFEVQDFDAEHGRVTQSFWSEAFPVPTGGGTIGDIMGAPPRAGMVRVLSTPPTSNTYDQYVLNQITGELYERTA